jgi:hypothetical protein
VLDSPVQIPDQQHCRYCGDPIPAGGRRPRQYCTDAHRQADFRKRHQEAANGSEPADQVANSPATISSKNSSTKSKLEFRNKRAPSVPFSVEPIDLLGGRESDVWHPQFRAAIDVEIGVGADWLRSPDGVRFQIVPRRAR